MKNIVVAGIVFLLGFAASVSAEDTIPKDVKALTDAVAALRAASSLTPQQAADEQARRERTSEIAGEVMELGAKSVTPAIAKIREVSPELWASMVRRQYAKAGERLVLPLGLFIFSLVLWSIARPLRRMVEPSLTKDRELSWVLGNLVGLVGGYVIPLLFVFDFLSNLLRQLSQTVGLIASPEYYAFQELLTSVLSKGM